MLADVRLAFFYPGGNVKGSGLTCGDPIGQREKLQ
jgi:hypothetical protein